MITINYGEEVEKTIHCIRHGEVENPEKILYGRLPNFHLSARGRESAEKLKYFFLKRKIKKIICSPLERTRETIEPYLKLNKEVDFKTDERIIEASNHFQGRRVSMSNHFIYCVKNPRFLRLLLNPFKPSWGEEYTLIANRTISAMVELYKSLNKGEEGIIVSHQLPIWILRRTMSSLPLVHNPYTRSCALASITTFTFSQDILKNIWYMNDLDSITNIKLNSIYRIT